MRCMWKGFTGQNSCARRPLDGNIICPQCQQEICGGPRGGGGSGGGGVARTLVGAAAYLGTRAVAGAFAKGESGIEYVIHDKDGRARRPFEHLLPPTSTKKSSGKLPISVGGKSSVGRGTSGSVGGKSSVGRGTSSSVGGKSSVGRGTSGSVGGKSSVLVVGTKKKGKKKAKAG